MTGDNTLFWMLPLSGENKLKLHLQNKNLVPLRVRFKISDEQPCPFRPFTLYMTVAWSKLFLCWVWHLWFALGTAYALFKLISIARYAFKFPSICFQGLHMKFSSNVLLACILYCDARPNCLITTDIIFSYIWHICPCPVFLWACHSFTSRKLI